MSIIILYRKGLKEVLLMKCNSCGLFERDNEKGGYSVTDYNVYL